jgi:Fe-S cluster biogenesis protein NfuA
MDDDLVAKYAAEAQAAMEAEAARRVAESTDPEEEERLRNLSLFDLLGTDHFIPALLARLGAVRAALDGHGGGIAVSQSAQSDDGLDLVLDLTGACLSCGAAPGTLEGVKTDLEADNEVQRVRFSSALLDTFDDLGREFILAHGAVEFVDPPSDEDSE